ncbi:MAG TPA: hypothetical protein VFL55_13990 [Acetobacteraceae bacterium]|nr:hypothetical protein [Acetobacteraceae bacterium]
MARAPLATATIIICSALAMTTPVHAQTPDISKYAKAVDEASTTLEQALSTSATNGTPISAQYMLKDEKLQIMVFTKAANGFMEVVIAPATGSIVSAQQVTDADDLEEAEKQELAMEKGSTSLLSAVKEADKQNPGARAVRVVPSIRGGQPMATVFLLKGMQATVSSQKLN